MNKTEGNSARTPVRFGMSTDVLSSLVTGVGHSNGALNSNEIIEVSGVEVSGPTTVVEGDIVERTMN